MVSGDSKDELEAFLVATFAFALLNVWWNIAPIIGLHPALPSRNGFGKDSPAFSTLLVYSITEWGHLTTGLDAVRAYERIVKNSRSPV